MIEKQIEGISFIAGNWPLKSDKSTLIFIHGAGGSNFLWRSQVDLLADRVNTVAIDLPGHADSQGSASTTVEDYTAAVAAFIKAIDAPSPIPCGLSMGGAIAMQLMLDHGKLVTAGILINTGAKLKVAPAIFETIENDYDAFVAMLGKVAFSKKTEQALRQSFMDDSAQFKPEIALGDFKACDEFNVAERLSQIEVPVLVMSAADDMLTPPKYADFLEQNIPDASLAQIVDAGHISPVEKPQEVCQAIRAFLDEKGL